MSEPADAGGPAAAPNATPWWARELKSLIPEARIWIAAAVFGLAWHALDLVADHVPAGEPLTKDPLFVSVVSGLFGGGGVLAVIGFWFIASKKDAAAQGGAS